MVRKEENMSKKRVGSGILLVCLSAVVGLAASGLAASQGNQEVAGEAPKRPGVKAGLPKAVYIGTAGCAICHKAKKRGEQKKLPPREGSAK